MVTIAIAGMEGSGSRILGESVAKVLGFDYVDRIVLGSAAAKLGTTVGELKSLEERSPNLLDSLASNINRILEKIAQTSVSGDPYFGPSSVAFLSRTYDELPELGALEEVEFYEDKVKNVLADIMNELTDKGDVVIVGRGAPIILGERRDVLRIGTVADLEDRVLRTCERERVSRDEALIIVQRRSDARRYYLDRHYGIIDPDDPMHYDFVVNTSRMNLDNWTALIATLTKNLQRV